MLVAFGAARHFSHYITLLEIRHKNGNIVSNFLTQVTGIIKSSTVTEKQCDNTQIKMFLCSHPKTSTYNYM